MKIQEIKDLFLSVIENNLDGLIKKYNEVTSDLNSYNNRILLSFDDFKRNCVKDFEIRIHQCNEVNKELKIRVSILEEGISDLRNYLNEFAVKNTKSKKIKNKQKKRKKRSK